MELQQLCKEAHAIATAKGWWDGHQRAFGDMIALIHSELSEALEEYRAGRAFNEVYFEKPPEGVGPQKPCGISVELADAIIRIADICEKFDINLTEVIRLKMGYNRMRPHRHGGKQI